MGFHKLERWLRSILKNSLQHKKLEDSIGDLQHALRVLTPQVSLEQVDIHLVEHCNLNCFACGHFSQLADEEYTDLATYEKDIKQLALLCGGGGYKTSSPNGWRATFTPAMQRIF